MPKYIYLIIIGIFSFGYIPPALVPDTDVSLLFLYFFLFFGFIYYRKEAENRLNNLRHNKWVVVLFILMFFSVLTPCIRYNQSIVDTLIAMRKEYLIVYVSLFFRMNLCENDWYKAFKFLGILSISSFFVVMFFPELYITKETLEIFYYRKMSGAESDIIATTIPGFTVLIFFFFMTFQRVIDHWRKSDIVWMLISVIFILLVQNRSTILGVIPPLIYVISKLSAKIKMVVIPLLLLVVGYFLFPFIENLVIETQNQLADKSYNRWQAIDFFLTQWHHNAYTILFGNGVACNGSQYLDILLDATKSRFAFISDIGLLGTFFQYGILVIIIIYTIVLKTLFGRGIPLFMKFYALWILLVPIIHCFGLGEMAYSMKAAIFAYLACYYLSIRKESPKTINS